MLNVAAIGGALVATAVLIAGPAAADRLPAPPHAAGASSLPDTCRDTIDAKTPQYVIGYGSLMNTQSKLRTAPNAGKSVPVRMNGFARSFSARVGPDGAAATMLALEPQEGAATVVALYRMFNVDNFIAQDQREDVYCRTAVPPDALDALDGSTIPTSGQIWFYSPLPNALGDPDADYPIIQSYIDLFLNGCFELAKQAIEVEDFVSTCIEDTQNWSRHWVNDRIHARRAYAYVENARAIDALLREHVPDAFAHRAFE